MASISNLANSTGPALDTLTAGVSDLVFGTGNNAMSAAVSKAITNNAKRANNENSISQVSNRTGAASKMSNNVRTNRRKQPYMLLLQG